MVSWIFPPKDAVRDLAACMRSQSINDSKYHAGFSTNSGLLVQTPQDGLFTYSRSSFLSLKSDSGERILIKTTSAMCFKNFVLVDFTLAVCHQLRLQCPSQPRAVVEPP